jgi:hypothetical protein
MFLFVGVNYLMDSFDWLLGLSYVVLQWIIGTQKEHEGYWFLLL